MFKRIKKAFEKVTEEQLREWEIYGTLLLVLATLILMIFVGV